ncbi:related to S-M checkpoint control protein Rad4p [Phialocephala subalpina]|uniref:Related to S-M checkpoint control protein Rad4p n=1 Tax=Phialocephala subalpina TaxID=576137 RepID=A0A1L7WX28_9HELO|nr:related to S-M checkpoint control protein Rad4p [Phialocephala subalpina]
MADCDGNASPKRIPLNESADLSAPLRGCVICCTSVPDEKRTEIAKYAEQMGATHRYDLTLDVTHLIVADYNTPKYRYVARERPDVQPMTIEWIDAVRELWINDQEIDFISLETEHRLPTFHTLKFSMTGCDDPLERAEIADQVKANGAIYEGDLTKQITHLISFRTEGAKYRAAKSWGLRIVSVEWLRDSIERGMILDEKLYDPALPINERGKGAWDKTKPKRTSLGKRSREGSTAEEGGKRKLRRTASTKLASQSQGLWGDIVGGGGMVAQVSRSGVWDNADDEASPQVQEPKAKAPVVPAKSSSMQSTLENPPIQGMFSGCRFYLYGFNAKQDPLLRNHLVTNSGEVADTIENLVDIESRNNVKRLFRIMPPDLKVINYPALPQSQLEIETITFWWVERCLHSKKFVEPSECILGRPFPMFPIQGFKKMIVSSSAFTGIDLLHLKKAVDLIGATYSEDMTPQSTVLVTKSLTALRLDKSECARDWNIPIVTADWLWECIESGQRLPWTKYKRRLAKKRTDSLPNSKEQASAKESSRSERSKSDIVKPVGTSSSSMHSSSTTRPPRTSGIDDDAFASDEPDRSTRPPPTSGLDDTAFADDEPEPNFKEEQVTQALSFARTVSSSTQELSVKAAPLSERNINSPTRTAAASTTSAATDSPATRPQEDIGNAISNLLAKTKTSAQPDSSENRRRGGNRILGRAASNVSAASRASSVDSTMSYGHPVQYPSGHEKTNEQIELLVNGDKNEVEDMESQPPSTQLQYDDPESTTAREIVMARSKAAAIAWHS